MMYVLRLKMSLSAWNADQQKELPSMAIMMYVLRLIHSMIFWRYHRQYCTQHAAYLMRMESLPVFLSWFTAYATMMRMNCMSATRNEPTAAEPQCVIILRNDLIAGLAKNPAMPPGYWPSNQRSLALWIV